MRKRLDKDSMPCNKPRKSPNPNKRKVVKACFDGKEKIIHFGDANMGAHPENPKRKKSFRARHKCDEKKSKLSAGYWSCKDW